MKILKRKKRAKSLLYNVFIAKINNDINKPNVLKIIVIKIIQE